MKSRTRFQGVQAAALAAWRRASSAATKVAAPSAPPEVPLTLAHYGAAAMAEAMQEAHYPLQALFYLVAAHRYLRWRLPGYDPETHLGGASYWFVRGMVGPATPLHEGAPFGVFSWRPAAGAIVALLRAGIAGRVATGALVLVLGAGWAGVLQADLLASRARCTVAYWHHPLFTSGPNGPQTYMRAIWRALHRAGVDLVLNGHDHLYERFAPQDPDGKPDAARGIRQFTAGTDGSDLYAIANRKVNSEVLLSGHCVLTLTLRDGGYDWTFVPVSGAGDRGSARCH